MLTLTIPSFIMNWARMLTLTIIPLPNWKNTDSGQAILPLAIPNKIADCDNSFFSICIVLGNIDS
jgi:hypothetical protein